MTKGIAKWFFFALAVGTLALAACSHRDLTPTPIYPTPSSIPSSSPSSHPSSAPSASPTAAPSASPTATPTGAPGTFPVTIVNSDSAITSSNINLYIYGQDNTTSAYEGVNADGSTYSLAAANSLVTPVAWSGGSSNTETVFVPALKGARIYIVDGATLSSIFKVVTAGNGPSAPAPWSKNDGSQSIYFDNVEYAETTPGNVNFDLSQTDAIGLDLEVTAVDSTGTQTIGLKPGALSAFAAALNLLGSPWSTLASEMPYHIINPQHGSPNFFPNDTFLDTSVMAAWNAYTGGNWMEITAASLSATGYSGPLYGTVDSSGNFDFYATQNTLGTLVGTIENPQTYATANSESITSQVLAQNGTFGNFMTPYPVLGPAVGNRLSGALNSGVMAATPPVTAGSGVILTVQPICTNRFPSSATAPYQNQFAGALHSIANTYAYVAGAAYGYPYDDLCGTSTDTTATGITQMTVTINPS